VAEELFATLNTNLGKIVVQLYPDKAPVTVENFVGLAEGTKEWRHPETGETKTGTSLYAGTIFHRIIDDFMIQGGDPIGRGIGGPGYEFEDEIHPQLRFDRPYLLAMANAGANTNGSQFFVTVVPTPHLNGRHTIFGEVVQGSEVVDAIAKTETGRNDRPTQDVVLESVTIERR
jgi:peptidyl-prolyl cis-trans isomerase A (cyclophilin A)